mmetsp:Transcript_28346/g.25039  ORF Transcript_28346/g.25039 Transcript_28346/m.25039 type:complete len:118 (-) Transcript_28346:8-361(-)
MADSKTIDASTASSGWKGVDGDDDEERIRKVLFTSANEKVYVEKWKEGSEMEVEVPENGLEIFVLSGSYGTWDNIVYKTNSYTRYETPNDTLTLMAGRESGCYLYIREGILNKKSKL